MKIDPKNFAQDYQLNVCIQCKTCTGMSGQIQAFLSRWNEGAKPFV